MEKSLQRKFFTYYNLLTLQDLWQAHYQILSIIFLKEFIELNVNMDMMIKNVRLVELMLLFSLIHKFSNYNDQIIFLLLGKGIYLYEYMDDWEKFNETSLPVKEDFYSHLNMEDITDADYAHAKRVCKDFEIKNLGEYHDLYVQSNTLLLADVFENFRNMCLKIYELDPAKFLSAPGLAWQAALKKTKVKLDLLTDIDMLLMVEKGIRGGICHSIYRYAKANNKYMKNYDKNKKSSYL